MAVVFALSLVGAPTRVSASTAQTPEPAPGAWFTVVANDERVDSFAWNMGDELKVTIHRPGTPEAQDFHVQDTVTGFADWDPELTFLSIDVSGSYDIQAGDVVTVT